MNDKENNRNTAQPEENEAVELNEEQLENVAGGLTGGLKCTDRDGKHKPPTRPGNKFSAH